MEASSIDFLPTALQMRKADAATMLLSDDTTYATIVLLVERPHDQSFSKGGPNQQTAYLSIGKDAVRVQNEQGAIIAEQAAKAVTVSMDDSQYVIHVRDKKFKLIDAMAIEPNAPFTTNLQAYQGGIEPLFTLLESKGATVQRIAHTRNDNRLKRLLAITIALLCLPLVFALLVVLTR
ncbi:MAG TPA: hypothetical protein VLA88_04040 [Candidatus Saccharimonadales bacterium]|nr:hypothetical protein [Candidatus Saccharimonadales bacterium]